MLFVLHHKVIKPGRADGRTDVRTYVRTYGRTDGRAVAALYKLRVPYRLLKERERREGKKEERGEGRRGGERKGKERNEGEKGTRAHRPRRLLALSAR